jgi:hypothetical protein
VVFALNHANIGLASEELPLTSPPLVKDQPDIRCIYRIGEEIVVRTQEYVYQDRKWYHFLWKLYKGRFVPFRSSKGDEVVAVSEGSLHGVIASYREKNVLIEFADQPDRNIRVCVRVEPPFLLGANDFFAFLVFSNRIVEVSNKGVIRIIWLKNIVPKRYRILPRAIGVTESEIILGYDKGEWGGLAVALRIEKSGVIEEPKILISENTRSIVHGHGGGIWIASGSSHLGLEEAGLHFYNGKTVTSIISQEGFMGKEDEDKNRGLLSLPQSSEISGIAVNPTGGVVILASTVGLFMYSTEKALEVLWKGKIGTIYSMPDCRVCSYPEGVVEKDGSLYIATGSLGVICFEKQNNGKYIPTKQILFKGNTSKESNSDSGD